MGNIDGNMIVPCGESVLYNDWGSNRDVSKKKSEYEGTYIYIYISLKPTNHIFVIRTVSFTHVMNGSFQIILVYTFFERRRSTNDLGLQIPGLHPLLVLLTPPMTKASILT